MKLYVKGNIYKMQGINSKMTERFFLNQLLLINIKIFINGQILNFYNYKVNRLFMVIVYCFMPLIISAQKICDYETIEGNVTFQGIYDINSDKALLYKRAKKFIALNKFDIPIKMEFKTGTTLKILPVDKHIIYESLESGEIFGEGFFRMTYKKHDHFTMNFDYVLKIKDGKFMYVIDNFRLLEYLDGPKQFTGVFFKNNFHEEGAIIKVHRLEEFCKAKKAWRPDCDKQFKDEVAGFIAELNSIMNGADLDEDW